ncbi:DUF1127 domain-containing protein [Benzoatithermus flavus]|uniref:DUF1127 domain-containing protein n=1 Tax=Benzoatithermus flavus TaxID=3108223 RepID=A0ABU8XVJ6_9PROT
MNEMTLYRRFRCWLAAERAARQVLAELSCYTDRELADIGLSRGDVPALAREAFEMARAASLRTHDTSNAHRFWTARHA